MKNSLEKINKEFEKALNEGYAFGAFNFSNMEILQAIIEGAKKENCGAILQVSPSALAYMGADMTVSMFKSATKNCRLPFFLHLDHGKDEKICQEAIDCGFDSVMIDASSLSLEENIELTARVVRYAHSKNVFVEAELGTLSGVEDEVSAQKNIYTDAKTAKYFVDKTGVDSLAVAIGTSHGAYKFKGEPRLRFDILEQIEKLLPHFPLVLHGASSVSEVAKIEFENVGGKLADAKGVPDELVRVATTKHNVCKVNVDTDLRIAFTTAVRECLKDASVFDPRKYLGLAKERVSLLVRQKVCNLKK